MKIKETEDTNKITDSIEKSKEKEFKRILGIAEGKFTLPDDIDECNDEIARMFGIID